MALPSHINTKVSNSFVEAGDNGETAQRVSSAGGMNTINPLAKFMEVSNTDTVTEVYRYYESSNKATLYNTVTIIYTTTAKTDLLSAEWD